MTPSDPYRRRVNALAMIASATFTGGNLFNGLFIGAYWISLAPLVVRDGFWAQFTTFLYTSDQGRFVDSSVTYRAWL